MNLLKQQENIQKQTGESLEFFESKKYLYFVEQEDGKLHQLSHWTTLGELKKRIKNKGENHLKMANLSLVMIYSYWEYYRSKIQERTKKLINSDLMGDIRHLRISIIHNKGIGNENMNKCKILNQFKEGDKIEIDDEYFEKIVDLIRKEINLIDKK